MRIRGAAQTDATPASAAAAARDAKLRKASQQLEGAFVQQMYKSMRDTIPEGGMFDGGSGEQMFTGMMDEHVAADTPLKWQHGLSEAIYRQMRGAMHQQHQDQQSADAATAASAAAASAGAAASASTVTATALTAASTLGTR